MSLFTRSSYASFVVTCGLLAACVDSPSLTASSDQASGGAAGGASGGPGGMVLVPEMTLDVGGGLAPTGTNPIPKGDAGKGDRGEKDDKGNGGDAGAGGEPGGSGEPGNASPQAPSPVVVPAFWLDATETTVESYRLCVASGTCELPTAAPGCTLNDGLEAHPVTCVTLAQARVFCTWSHKRLVTGDEYSAAAGGASRRAYPWGAEPPAADRLNACGSECTDAGLFAEPDGFPRTAPAASFPNGRTPEGAFDLAGNVAEWVEGGALPVARGGSYEDALALAVSASSARVGAVAGPSTGFRCAADAAGR